MFISKYLYVIAHTKFCFYVRDFKLIKGLQFHSIDSTDRGLI